MLHAQVGTRSIPGTGGAAPAHAPRYCSVINYLLQAPQNLGALCALTPQFLQGAGSSIPGTWGLPSPLTLWYQDLVLLLFCTGDLLLPRDCQGILLTPSSFD